jgi:hypothetical protein
MLTIKFSQHAEAQLKTRNISHNRVKQTISKPEKVSKSYRGRKVLNRKYNSKILEVIIREGENDIIVITAYYLD